MHAGVANRIAKCVAQRITKPDGPDEPIAPADAYSAANPAAVTDVSGGQPQTNSYLDAQHVGF